MRQIAVIYCVVFVMCVEPIVRVCVDLPMVCNETRRIAPYSTGAHPFLPTNQILNQILFLPQNTVIFTYLDEYCFKK